MEKIMLDQLLKLISPQTMSPISNNIAQVQQMLTLFDNTYQSFGKALTQQQQVFISNNLGKMDAYFKSETGKQAIGMLVEEFETFVKA